MEAGGWGRTVVRKSLHPRLTRERVVFGVAAVAVAVIFVGFMLFPRQKRNELRTGAPRQSRAKSAVGSGAAGVLEH